MTNLFFTRRAAVGGLLCLATALALAACGGAAAPTALEPAETETAADSQAEAAPTTDEAVDEMATTEATEEETAIASAPAVAASPPAVCEPIDIPDNRSLPAPDEDDWALGPDTAAITVIEYGDFQ
ncbi:MAG: hypothetical protein KDI79_08995 [Anaerolineae bacterium]|nr:hypothetical protein [Anaerolineae bacterium]